MQRPSPRARQMNRDPRTAKIDVSVSSWLNFTPMQLNPQLWLDAADSSTITLSGSSVTQWNDKSGNGYNVSQGNAANQPAIISFGLNGLDVIDFDGSNDVLTRGATNLARNITGGTVYCVYAHDVVPTTGQIAIKIAQSATVTRQVVSGFSGKIRAGGRTLDNDSFQFVLGSRDIIAAEFIIATGLFVYSNTDLFVYFNKALDGSLLSYQSNTTTSNTASGNLGIGASEDATEPFNGKIAEILVFHTAHTAQQRTAVWSYLANKWGLTI